MTDILPDRLGPGLRLVVCGSAAGRRSAELGAYYAGPGNQFWSMLHRIGATPRLLRPAEFPSLLDYRVGLTDMAKKKFGADSELTRADFDPGALLRSMDLYQPLLLAFNGKRAARAFFGRDVDYGYQQGEDIGRTRVHVAPSTSGAARGFWDEGFWRRIGGEMGSIDDL